jgi:RNA polymerase sigma-70 factor (ECF subfamily)
MERRLVEQAQRGDRGAFSELAREASPRLFRVAQRILRDHGRAEDATQQALVQIWRTLPRLKSPERFEAWAYRILVNACYSESRRERRAAPTLSLLDADASASDEAGLIADRDALNHAFLRLPADQRAVLVLQYYLDLGHAEIAQILEVPLGTVKSRSHSGRQALRAALEADARATAKVGMA